MQTPTYQIELATDYDYDNYYFMNPISITTTYDFILSKIILIKNEISKLLFPLSFKIPISKYSIF